MNSSSLDQLLCVDCTNVFDGAIDAGVADPVTKRFHLSEVLGRLKSILRIQRLKDELEKAVAYKKELEKNLPNP